MDGQAYSWHYRPILPTTSSSSSDSSLLENETLGGNVDNHLASFRRRRRVDIGYSTFKESIETKLRDSIPRQYHELNFVQMRDVEGMGKVLDKIDGNYNLSVNLILILSKFKFFLIKAELLIELGGDVDLFKDYKEKFCTSRRREFYKRRHGK